jgi:hypothetical protein
MCDRKLVWKVPYRLVRSVAKRQMRVLPGVETALQMTHEMPPLVDRRPEPCAGRFVEHGIEEHHALDHPPGCRWLSKAVVRFADGRPERLVVDVEHATAMELPRRDRRRESSLDKTFDEVGALLTVDDACEAAILALDENTRVQQHVHEKTAPDVQ